MPIDELIVGGVLVLGACLAFCTAVSCFIRANRPRQLRAD
jgi:hypothetical protein